MTASPASDPRAGFTLVESVVAMLIAAVAFAGVYQLYAGAARLERAASEIADMTRIAEDLMANLDRFEPGREESGETDGYVWTLNGGADPEGMGVVRLTVSVVAPGGRQIRLVTERAGSRPEAP